ncbi:MAG TPA: alpha-2-macroglobulin [Chitinophagales bacterium]|nr:alpha-2-macroglobulin [Chitinophagales bacterium]
MRAKLIWPGLLALGLYACNADRNTIAIKTGDFPETIELRQNLEIHLNQHVFNDSLFDKWVDADLLQIDPPVEGRFKIVSSDAFYFSPSKGFAESEAYTATLGKDLFNYTDLKLALKSAPVNFHTTLLDLTAVNTYWFLEPTSGEVKLNAGLQFTASVDPQTLGDMLTVKVDGTNKTSSITSTQSADNMAVTISGISPKAKDQDLNIDIRAGIGSPGSRYKTPKPLHMKVPVAPVEDLEIRDITANHDGIVGTITVESNQQFSNTNLEELVKIEPSIPVTIEKTLNGLVVTSEQFNASQTYVIILSDKLRGVAGGKMVDTYQQSVTFGELEPSIEFTQQKARYLGGKGERNISVRIVNVPKVQVNVVKIYENNILAFLRDGFSWDWYESYDAEEEYWDYHDYQNVNTSLYGNVVYTEEIETSKLEKYNSARVLHLDFTDKLERFDGIYVVTVSAAEKVWLTDAQIVSISDIGLIAKATEDELVVFANSIQTAEPMSGIKVSFISSNNQKLYTASTDKNGVARFTGLKQNMPDFNVNLITAKNGSDYNYLPFSETEVSTSRFDVGGKRLNSSDIDAFLYPERDLYRPGETMHIAGILRTYDWQLLDRIPVKIKVISPSGKDFKTLRKTIDDQGGFETGIDIPKNAVTGTYTVQLFSSNDILLASEYISIEEFMPDRIKVSGSLNKQNYYPGESVQSTIVANNLYGTPAAERNYESEFNLQQHFFSSKKYPAYNFQISGGTTYFPSQNAEGQTDENGQAVQSYTIDQTYSKVGLLDGRILNTVFDESGRPVYQVQNFTVITQSNLLGIGEFDYYVKVKSPLRIPMIAVDKDDKGYKTQDAHVEIIKYDYETVIEKHRNYYSYRSNRKEKILQSYDKKISGDQDGIWFTPQQSGEYQIRLYLKDAKAYVEKSFYAYGWGSTQNNSFEVNTEGNINIISDKPKYDLGEEAEFLFTTPFNGKLLVTVEREKVIEYHYLDTEKKAASLKIKMNQSHVPNVFVTATLFRPNDESGMPLTVAHGIINVEVKNPAKAIPLTVTHEDHSRANTKQTINIKTAPNAQVTVAVVDEGILQIKNFTTPDPYNWFYMQHALGVFSYDLYAYLYPEIYLKKMLSGGDAMMNEGRLNPMTANRVKLVSYWSGILKADASGKIAYTIDIPQFSGDLRVMVAAYRNDQFGASESHMKVSDPLVMTTSLPRFLTPGDTIDVPITLANTTDKKASGKVTMSIEGPIKVVGSSTQQFNANANKEARSVFKIVAWGATGNAKVKVQSSALGETFTDITEIPVRPPAGLQKYSGEGYLDGNKSITVNMQPNLISSSAKARLMISYNPLVQFADDLDYLVQYPHGCVEQMTSSAFPQLYYADMVKSFYSKERPDLDPAYNVQETIRILQSMQMYNGALTYWPGGGYESWWGSIYAAHFLLEAKKAGYDVDQKTLDKLLGYLRTMLKQKKTYVYYYDKGLSVEMAAQEVFYSMYVLAVSGKAEMSMMNYYKANLSMVPQDGKYLLAMSYMLAGDKRSADKLLPGGFTDADPKQQFNGSFNSPIRDRAIALNCMLEADPNNQQIGRLSQQLSEMVKNARYMNTQERAFTFLAFGKLAKQSKEHNAKVVIKIGGKEAGTFDGTDLVIEDTKMASSPVTLNSSGSGRVYYFWYEEGVSADGSVKLEDNFLRVRKSFFNRWGQPIDLKNIHQNDLVVVKISLVSATGTYVENIAITDILPAGFEIENDRLRATNSMPWIQNQSEAQHEDIRDDRILLYTDATAKEKYFYYTVRAVTTGTFKMGPIMADAMYNEEYHSYNGGGWVTIKK